MSSNLHHATNSFWKLSGLKPGMKKLIVILICGQLFFSCDKDEISGNCESLADGILNNNIDKVRPAVTDFIDGLASKEYNAANLAALVQKISSQCNTSCVILCFDCIDTLPSQSEIRIVMYSGGTTVARTIDISYSTNNMMTFRNMHD